MKRLIAALALLLCLTSFAGCGVWKKDATSKDPAYRYKDEQTLTFVLELREPGTGEEIAEGDAFPHSTIDGALIASWEVPMYGNTVYESVVKFFEDRADDNISFRLSQHTFYMFHECTLSDGSTYNLETVYVAADGKYANCANYQSVLGGDGVAGTDDDLKVLTLVYRGWLY